MSQLPIVHMTLYKHGVGFFRRRGTLDGESVKLTFRREEMDDLLKSLTVIDLSGGQVRGVDYDTPQSKQERLSGCSINLGDNRSLRDLLTALRGRDVALALTDGSDITGTLVGLDETEDKPLKRMLVSILEKDKDTAKVIPLQLLSGVTISDGTAAEDLRFFLQTATGRETHRSITIRLSPGTHELEVSYIAPAPGWRVSYRLVTETDGSDKKNTGAINAFIQGWGIFDNRLEEDLAGISLSLTAGMPISFIYDLYTPHIRKRPVVKDEFLAAAGPVMFESAVQEDNMIPEAEPPMAGMGAGVQAVRMAKFMAGGAPAPAPAISMQSMADSVQTAASGEALGALFQYNVDVPVTVGRGQSAMVPIVAGKLDTKKDLIYNGAKTVRHPVATLRFKNTTGLTLERGPVTVLENGEYVGEAVLPFTTDNSEAVISYAIEMGVHITEDHAHEANLSALEIKDQFLLHQNFDVRRTVYRIDNRTGKVAVILIERRLNRQFIPFDTPEPAEKTIDTYRYRVEAAAGKVTEFTVQERCMRTHRQHVTDISFLDLQRFLEGKFLDKTTYNQLKKLLDTVAAIAQLEGLIKQQENQRKGIYDAQTQIQKNMGVLTKEGEEGKLRGRYVSQLTEKEEELAQIQEVITRTRKEIESKRTYSNDLIAGLSKK